MERDAPGFDGFFGPDASSSAMRGTGRYHARRGKFSFVRRAAALGRRARERA